MAEWILLIIAVALMVGSMAASVFMGWCEAQAKERRRRMRIGRPVLWVPRPHYDQAVKLFPHWEVRARGVERLEHADAGEHCQSDPCTLKSGA